MNFSGHFPERGALKQRHMITILSMIHDHRLSIGIEFLEFSYR
jgi:hypothetical protein